jgi:hypothetical protein
MQLKYEFEAYVVMCVYIFCIVISLSNNSVERRWNVHCVFMYNILWTSHFSPV